MSEVWKDVVGYEGLYQVSDHGRVWSNLNDQVLKHKITARGYHRIELYRPRHIYFVHVLVLNAFVGLCPRGMECCHFDGDKHNNRLSNLRWDTRSNNRADTIRNGKTPGRYPVQPVIRNDGQKFGSLRRAAKASETYLEAIKQVCEGKRKSAGGFTWKYV